VSPRRFTPDRLLPGVALSVGLLLLLGAGSLFAWQWSRTSGLERVVGQVTRYQQRAPVVEYFFAGETYTVLGPITKSPPRVGDTQIVYVPASDPTDARLPSLLFQWIFPAVLGVAGSRFFAASVRLLRT
jgi:hypothetical protein